MAWIGSQVIQEFAKIVKTLFGQDYTTEQKANEI